jgi:hypothetical protein
VNWNDKKTVSVPVLAPQCTCSRCGRVADAKIGKIRRAHGEFIAETAGPPDGWLVVTLAFVAALAHARRYYCPGCAQEINGAVLGILNA